MKQKMKPFITILFVVWLLTHTFPQFAAAYDAEKIGYFGVQYLATAYELEYLAGTECGYLVKNDKTPHDVIRAIKKTLRPSDSKEMDTALPQLNVQKESIDLVRPSIDMMKEAIRQGRTDIKSGCKIVYDEYKNEFIEQEKLWQDAAKQYGR